MTTQASTQTRSIRWTVALVAIPFVLLIAAFVAIPFIASDEVPLNPVGPVSPAPGAERGGTVFLGTANVWEVRGNVTQDASGAANFSFTLRGPNGHPPRGPLELTLELDQPDSGRPVVTLPLQNHGAGSYSAKTPVLSAGPWRLRMRFAEVTARFNFTAI